MGCPEKWTKPKADKLGRDLLEWVKESEDNIFWEEFLLERGLYKEIVAYLSHKFPKSEFIDSVKLARRYQEIRLCKYGMMSKKPTMPIFLLKVHHGYSETGIMGRDIEPESDDKADLSTKAPEDLLKDVKRQLGKE